MSAEQEVADWNERHPEGTPIRYWPGVREGEGKRGVTRSRAWVMSGHASVLVTGQAGSIALSHVEAVVEQESHDTLKPAEEEGPEDDYQGGEGWVVVAVGRRGRACYMAIDPGFGALRYWVEEDGLEDPADAELDPGEEGIWRARAKVWSHRSYEGDYDMGFTLTSKWEAVSWPLPKEAP